MTALAADIGAATRDAIIAQWADGGVIMRYPSARDAMASPATGYFDALADAETAIDQRGALIGVERRRFSIVVQEVLWFDPLAGMPTVRLVDPEQRADAAFLVSRIAVDLDAETTTLEVFG